jgi:hypothetical protein
MTMEKRQVIAEVQQTADASQPLAAPDAFNEQEPKANPATDVLSMKDQKQPLKRPIDAIEDTAPTQSPQELELARLQKQFEEAQIERRALLRQIQEMLDERANPADLDVTEDTPPHSIADSEVAESVEGPSRDSSAPGDVSELPSVAAHSSPPPPLTKAEEDEASSSAQAVIKEHIKLLSKYNEIRDIGQGLIGMVAESRRVRIRDCQEEFGVTDGD